jgi:MFS transporter, DHA2 family, methylenomycin A resistance protein
MSTLKSPAVGATTPLEYWIPVLATGAAFFMIVLDTSIVNLALAKIGGEFKADIASLQWLVDGYALIFASLLLGSGAIGDRLGVKGSFMVGLLIFTVASGVCGIAPTMATLQFARIAQGIGAALLLPNSLAALNHTFQDPTQRAKAIGAWSSAGALGIAVGPVLGGILVQTLGWRSIFVVNLPVGVIALWMTQQYVPKAPRHPHRAIDPLGQILAVSALGALTYTLIELGRASSSFHQVLSAAGIFVILAIAFVVIENKQSTPMLPLRLLLIRTLGPVALVGLMHNVAIYGLIFVLSLKFQRLLNLAPMHAGLLFLPMTIALAVGTRVGSKILRHHGPFLPLIGGHLAAGAGAIVLAVADQSIGPILASIPLIVIGFGAGITTPAMGVAVLGSVERSQGGLASGILNSARQTGGVMGVAVLGALLGDPITWSGVHLAELAAALMLCLASTAAYFASRGYVKK